MNAVLEAGADAADEGGPARMEPRGFKAELARLKQF
jgi:hypothetical protein